MISKNKLLIQAFSELRKPSEPTKKGRSEMSSNFVSRSGNEMV